MAQHVRMHGKRHLSDLAEAGNEMVKAHWADWPATFGNEDVGFRRVFSPQFAQSADLIAANRVNAWRAALGPADVQTAGIELDLMPLQIAHLRSSEAVTI